MTQDKPKKYVDSVIRIAGCPALFIASREWYHKSSAFDGRAMRQPTDFIGSLRRFIARFYKPAALLARLKSQSDKRRGNSNSIATR